MLHFTRPGGKVGRTARAQPGLSGRPDCFLKQAAHFGGAKAFMWARLTHSFRKRRKMIDIAQRLELALLACLPRSPQLAPFTKGSLFLPELIPCSQPLWMHLSGAAHHCPAQRRTRQLPQRSAQPCPTDQCFVFKGCRCLLPDILTKTLPIWACFKATTTMHKV